MSTRAKQVMAALMAVMMVTDVVLPSMVYALSSGPSQPEVQGFQPAGTNDMVDLFTGDLSYNISLLDVEGYPLNLFYSAGVGVDQEASWVGLGWNLNPGVVERNLRGIPDDFHGDEITREMHLRPNRSFGLSFETELQTFSVEIMKKLKGQLGLDMTAAARFNNYEGVTFERGVGMSFRSTSETKTKMCARLGVTASSNQAMRMQPSIGFEYDGLGGENAPVLGMNFGMTIDSKEGLVGTSFGAALKGSKPSEKNSGHIHRSSLGVGTSFDIGPPTYQPQVSMPMRNNTVSLYFTLGTAVSGLHPNTTLGGFFSAQGLRYTTRKSRAFGYLHLGAGQHDHGAMLDFNRERDGAYSSDRVALGIAALTPDVFSVSGQGAGGSYRAFRSEVGHVFDMQTSTQGEGGSFGLDAGAGLLAHGGSRITNNIGNSRSGAWRTGNHAASVLSYGTVKDHALEPVYFREANEATVESDPSLWASMKGDRPASFLLPRSGRFEYGLGRSVVVETPEGGAEESPLPSVNHRKEREPRAQLFSYLTREETEHLGLEPRRQDTYDAPGHHIGEVTTTGRAGERYVYGLPAYNRGQYDVEFNAGPLNGTGSSLPSTEGLVEYVAGTDDTKDNRRGKDHFYSKTYTPPYAYAFLLTGIVSADYSDIDDTKGPSDGDLGTWTRFHYERKHDDFEWRTPVSSNVNKARLVRGNGATNQDDRGTYVHGTKEVWYLKEVETRNYVAIFHTKNREDALGVGQHGEIRTGQRLQLLDSICLYEKSTYRSAPDPDAVVPIKTVHFRYAYELCPGTPNTHVSSKNPSGGKLTLKKVWFTYGRSRLGVSTPYVFEYGTNPAYDMHAHDRWGSPKADRVSWLTGVANIEELDPEGDAACRHVRNEDFPYAEQVPDLADLLAGAWALKAVRTPSGGRIEVEYESDDYAYVQQRRAMRMFRVCSVTDDVGAPDLSGGGMKMEQGIGPLTDPREVLWFRIPKDLEPVDGNDAAKLSGELTSGLQRLYFRFKVDMWGNNFDHVSGYATGPFTSGVIEHSGKWYGYVKLNKVDLDEKQLVNYKVNPIYRAALENVQVKYPSATAGTIPKLDDEEPFVVNVLRNAVNSTYALYKGMADMFKKPNMELHAKLIPDFCKSAVRDESWIRLNEPDYNKKGGGYRVKSLRLRDGWAGMEQAEGTAKSHVYGQDFIYGDAKGSCGVAAYEPMSGADENPYRLPWGKDTRVFSPDERFYQEEPFGEGHFPSPVVGYSKVIVRDHVPDEQLRAVQGTGTVVHEFHTARDFPTITDRTSIVPARGRNNANLFAFLGFKKIDHMHASQGFVIETNDMHGKPYRTTVYPEGSDRPVSYVEYEYATKPYGPAKRLVNTATVIGPDGRISQAEIGRQYEFVSDMREFVSNAYSGGSDVKFELMYVGVAGLNVPICLPQSSSESTRFKTGTLVKKVHRFGLLKKMTRMENGSAVSVENLAHDALTGEVLLTRTWNQFQDPVYTMAFPAYWQHDGMGPAYKNMGLVVPAMQVAGGQAQVPSRKLVPGDELALTPSGAPAPPLKGWVDHVEGNAVRVVDRGGRPIADGTYKAKVLRSGRRNMLSAKMMEMTLLSDPLVGLSRNVYHNIIDAKAMEFSSEWSAECACVPSKADDPDQATNRWVQNQQGVWRLSKENVRLSERTRSVENRNANIRRDGTYTSFAPFYTVHDGRWKKEPGGWTTVREVTQYGMRGQELENRDALGLYSSATFGYRASLPKSVARNAKYAEAGFDGFEDHGMDNCGDKHFRFELPEGALTTDNAHTGKWSIRVGEEDVVRMGREKQRCMDGRECAVSLDYCDVMNGGMIICVLGTVASWYDIGYEIIEGHIFTLKIIMDEQKGYIEIYDTHLTPWVIRLNYNDSNGCFTSKIFSWPPI